MKEKLTIFVMLLAGITHTDYAQDVQWIYQQKQEKKGMRNQSEIYFVGGCFWGTEHSLKQIRGIKSTQTGYANGSIANPTYQQVCIGKTNLVETVKVDYNPQEVLLKLLIDLFFKTIDSTSLSRRGNDRGTQYRTSIYYTDEADLFAIRNAIGELVKEYSKPIIVEVKPLSNFCKAGEYYQDYLDKNPEGYYHVNPALFELAKKANAQGAETPQTSHKKPDDAILRNKLTAEQYAVTQKNATEPAFHSEYWNERRDGICIDITTGEPLSISTDKLNSGCGQPSSTKPTEGESVKEKTDTSHGMMRAEVWSKTGDVHLRHVFTDGPKDKGGLRYCINSASLRFIPKEKMQEEGYGEYLKLLPQE